MSDLETRPSRGGFKDRRAGLVLFGVLAIVVGSFLGLLAILTPAALLAGSAATGEGTAAQGAPPTDPRALVLGTVLYLVLASLFVWIGIGSIRIRRWVRPIALILSWTWLLAGLVGLASWLVMLPSLRTMVEAAQPAGESPLDAGAYRAITLIASAFIALAYVVLPAAFIWFYQDRSVRTTLETHDPLPRWTDRCPLPVLGLSLGLWAGAALCLAGFAWSTVPLFGMVLTGAPAAGMIAALACLCAWLGLATYRLKPAGWWGTLLLTLVGVAAQAVTFLRLDIVDIYVKLGVPEDQLAPLRGLGGAASAVALAVTVIFGLACVAYMLYVRRYFPRSGPGPSADEA